MATGKATRALGGDKYCGDQLGHWQKGHQITLCIADGLGHGKYAQIAAKAAMKYVSSHLTEPLSRIFFDCNKKIRDTRGVAMGIAVIDKKDHTLTYAGIGNTRILVLRCDDLKKTICKTQYLRSDYGIVGGGYKNFTPETIPFVPGDIAMLYTDGVKELIDFTRYTPVLYENIQLLAETIVKDWCRDTDDAAVLIYTLD